MSTLRWNGPTTYEDGLAYGQADHGGYEIEVNGQSAVAVPVAWNSANTYTFPVKDLPHLKQGTNALRMRTVAANGEVSVWTDPTTFSFRSTPKAPTGVVVG